MIFLIFPKGVDGRLLRKIMAESAESTIDKALERLNVSREKEKIILKREQETAVKELLAGRHGNFAHRVRQKPNIHRFCHCEGAIAIRKDVCDFSRLRRSWRLRRQLSLDWYTIPPAMQAIYYVPTYMFRGN